MLVTFFMSYAKTFLLNFWIKTKVDNVQANQPTHYDFSLENNGLTSWVDVQLH